MLRYFIKFYNPQVILKQFKWKNCVAVFWELKYITFRRKFDYI